jgi:hypothetical protein
MNILHRLKKLEQNNLNKPPCFCGKTFIDVWHGEPGFSGLTYCPNCKDEYEMWAKLAIDAATPANLTDIGTEKYNDSN